jgi:hypothetical protein
VNLTQFALKEQIELEKRMSIQDPIARALSTPQDAGFMGGYLEALSLVERLHRLLLDVIKDEFERVGVLEINAVQAMLLFNIGDNEVTAGELKAAGITKAVT